MTTVKEMKEALKDLPDDMVIVRVVCEDTLRNSEFEYTEIETKIVPSNILLHKGRSKEYKYYYSVNYRPLVIKNEIVVCENVFLIF